MANIPGGDNLIPDAVTIVETKSTGVSVPGGTRTAAIIGEGLRFERIVSSAVGDGNDGLDETYSSTNGRDGRHFLLSQSPIISNRTVLYKNGVALVGYEQAFDENTGTFASRYDYRINITNGKIELQTAALVDLGGAYYSASALNTGNGTISNLSLLDENAPTETWSIRCVSVRRDGYGDPIDGYAKFIAQGTVSGILLDGYGNQITWQSDGTVTNNGILQFKITEGATNFVEGDRFTIKVKGGTLVAGDSLVANYIAESDLNDPEFFTDMDQLVIKHGFPSTTYRLSLGAQLAFAQRPPGIWAVQASPAIPRRVSYQLEASASGSAASDDLQFNLPLNVVPDTDSNINFFVTDAATGEESQIIPNKVAFYDATYTASPDAFIFGANVYAYTVVLEDAVIKEGDDGEIVSIGPSSATISSTTVLFDSGDVGKSIKILTPDVNAGTYTIASVTDGVATISSGSFTDSTSVEFEVIDDTLQTAKILFTDDLALAAGSTLRATVVDNRDANFFDVNWASALESLEKIDCDIVVPLPSQTISAIFQATKAHCETMSNVRNKRERVLFAGAIQGLTPDNLLGNEDAAVEDIGILEGLQGDSVTEILAGNTEDLTNYAVEDAFGSSFRVVYFYPDEIVVPIGADRYTIDGFFLGAAAAGYLCSVPNVAIPLTNKVLTGFSILRSKLLRPIIIENLAAKGITVLQPVSGGGNVVWGKTTTNSGFPEEEEISIIFIRDKIAKSLRKGFKGFIGKAEDNTFQGTLMARANGLLQSFVSQGLITAFRDLRVVRDSVDPRQWNISVQCVPTYPVNWIFIRVGIGI